MHDSAFETGRLFLDTLDSTKKVLEIGSYSVNGGLRNLYSGKFEWIGLDLNAGPGVDVVCEDPYIYPFEDGSFDVCVSSSVFEHDEFFWLTFLEISRVLRPGGLFYLNAPSNGFVHRFPLDVWRFYPDAGIALQNWSIKNNSPLNLIESFTSDHGVGIWNDFVAVFQKESKAEKPRLYSQVKCRNIRVYNADLNEFDILKDSAWTQEIQESHSVTLVLRRKLGRLSHFINRSFPRFTK